MTSFHFSDSNPEEIDQTNRSWDTPLPSADLPGESEDQSEPGYPFGDPCRQTDSSSWSPSEWDDPWQTSLRETGYPPEVGYPPEMGYPPGDDEEQASQESRAATSSPEQKFFGSSLPASAQSVRPPVPQSPLKVVCVGPTFRVGGVRQHALALSRFLDPARARITEFVVTEPSQSPKPRDRSMPAPVTRAEETTFQRVAETSDVMLMWGAGYNGRIPNRRAVRVFLAHGESWWTRNALEESAQVVDHVIAVSDKVRRSICHGFPTTTILNGVDTARLGQTAARQDLRRRFAFSESDFVVGSIGRFTREKQFHLLMESLTRLPERFKLLLVGSGRRHAELLDHANRHIPGRFAMVAANDYLGDYYTAMDAFGLVSAHEGFGLVLAEAMMCGRPVISTKVGCAQEVILDRVNGLLVDQNPDSIAEAFRLLQEHPRWARGLAEEGHHFANNHLHASRMAREYEDLLLNLHSERQSRRKAAQ